MQKKHFLVLEDGTIFYGHSCGAAIDTPGEAVFNTGMTGYQEIVSDPSYYGQFVVLSTSEVGNYGCNATDMESRGLFLNGLIVREMNDPSNYRAEESLPDLLKRFDKPALSGIDTRRLVLHLRAYGTQKGFIHASDRDMTPESALDKVHSWPGLDRFDSTAKVSCSSPYFWNHKGELKIVAMDFGIKTNILHGLEAEGMQVEVVPSSTTASEILARRPDGVFLSNGPGDPAGVLGAIETAKNLIGKIPLAGICLGHQILALACGAVCARLKFGHHGCNHPVRDLIHNTIAITSQNHNFAVLPESLPSCMEVTHLNLNDGTIEGIRHKTEPVYSVQYHPEAAPGPHDSRNIFTQFRQMME